MIRSLLRALNGLFLVLLVAIGMAIQTSLFYPWPLPYFQPDLVLIVVLWCSFKRSFEEGGILTLLISNMSEIHSAAPQGLFLITYMFIYLFMRAASKLIIIPNVIAFAWTAMLSSFIWKVIAWGVLHLITPGGIHSKYNFTTLLMGAAVDGIFSAFLYKWIERFDWITYKSIQQEQALQDELQFKYDEGVQ